MVDVFRRRILSCLPNSDKAEREREVSWCGLNGIIAGVQEIDGTREGVAALMNDAWHTAVIGFGSVSSRILWIKIKFSRVKGCMVAVSGLTEGEVEEMERFMNDLDRVVDRVGNGYRLCVLGDLNSGENDDGRRVIDFCAEMDL